jgi:hypothetical protein
VGKVCLENELKVGRVRRLKVEGWKVGRLEG